MTKMYTIGDLYNEDFYYDFAKQDFTIFLESTALLPTQKMAEAFIEEELDSSNVVFEVTIYQITKEGVWEFNVQQLPKRQAPQKGMANDAISEYHEDKG